MASSSSASSVDRSIPLFPNSLTHAVNDSYGICFVGIIEFLERSLVDYHSSPRVEEESDFFSSAGNATSKRATSLPLPPPPLPKSSFYCACIQQAPSTDGAASSTANAQMGSSSPTDLAMPAGQMGAYYQMPTSNSPSSSPINAMTAMPASCDGRGGEEKEKVGDVAPRTHHYCCFSDHALYNMIVYSTSFGIEINSTTLASVSDTAAGSKTKGKEERSEEHDGRGVCRIVLERNEKEEKEEQQHFSEGENSDDGECMNSHDDSQTHGREGGGADANHTTPPTRVASNVSRCHLGISFNGGKDSMVMLHLTLNAIENLVAIGDWLCERYYASFTVDAASAASYTCGEGEDPQAPKVANVSDKAPKVSDNDNTLVRRHHLERFKAWRRVLMGLPPPSEEKGCEGEGEVRKTDHQHLHAAGDVETGRVARSDLAASRSKEGNHGKSVVSPCDNKLLAFLFSHLVIFYFEDKDEIASMRTFLHSLLHGLDLPVFDMDAEGRLRLQKHYHTDHHTTSKDNGGHSTGWGASRMRSEDMALCDAAAAGAPAILPPFVGIAASLSPAALLPANANNRQQQHDQQECCAVHDQADAVDAKPKGYNLASLGSSSSSPATAATCCCQRFHSRSHTINCMLSSDAIRSKSLQILTNTTTTTTTNHPTAAAEARAVRGDALRSSNIFAAQEEKSLSGVAHHRHHSSSSSSSPPRADQEDDEDGKRGATQRAHHRALYRGAKVICVSEHAGGMIKGLSLLKSHFYCHHAFLGVRCEDIGGGWRQEPIEMTSSNWPRLLRCCPIFSWSYSQVWMYLFKYDIPFSHLYVMGISSCGPSARTVRNPSCIVAVDEGRALRKWRALMQQQRNTLASCCGDGDAAVGVVASNSADGVDDAALRLLHRDNRFCPAPSSSIAKACELDANSTTDGRNNDNGTGGHSGNDCAAHHPYNALPPAFHSVHPNATAGSGTNSASLATPTSGTLTVSPALNASCVSTDAMWPLLPGCEADETVGARREGSTLLSTKKEATGSAIAPPSLLTPPLPLSLSTPSAADASLPSCEPQGDANPTAISMATPPTPPTTSQLLFSYWREWWRRGTTAGAVGGDRDAWNSVGGGGGGGEGGDAHVHHKITEHLKTTEHLRGDDDDGDDDGRHDDDITASWDPCEVDLNAAHLSVLSPQGLWCPSFPSAPPRDAEEEGGEEEAIRDAKEGEEKRKNDEQQCRLLLLQGGPLDPTNNPYLLTFWEQLCGAEEKKTENCSLSDSLGDTAAEASPPTALSASRSVAPRPPSPPSPSAPQSMVHYALPAWLLADGALERASRLPVARK